MGRRTHQVAAWLGLATLVVAVVAIVALRSTLVLLRDTLGAGAPATQPAPATQAPKRAAAPAMKATEEAVRSTPSEAEPDLDHLPGESEGQRAKRVAVERNPELGALLDDSDPSVRGAMQAFFRDDAP